MYKSFLVNIGIQYWCSGFLFDDLCRHTLFLPFYDYFPFNNSESPSHNDALYQVCFWPEIYKKCLKFKKKMKNERADGHPDRQMIDNR